MVLDIAVKISGRAVAIGRLDWGWKIRSQDGTHTWLLARGFGSLLQLTGNFDYSPHGPLHRADGVSLQLSRWFSPEQVI